MPHDISSIAGMVINPAAGPSFTANKISETWESTDPAKTLLQRLEEVADEYAYNIDTEAGWNKDRKIKAVEIELNLRIRKKPIPA